MNNASNALADATLATAFDPTYAKGFYRKGMAELKLNQPADAKESFLEGIKLVPDDKAFKDQLDKLSASGVASKASSTPAAKPAITPAATHASTAPKATEPAIVKPTRTEKEKDDVPGGVFRGYKKTSDGRVTTFFNNELDESTKALIGNIAPKKIDAPDAPAVAPAASGSVWNAAGKI